MKLKEFIRRRKISKALKGRRRSAEHCKNLSLALMGKKFTLEHRKHCSKAHKGVKLSKQHRKALSLSLIGNTHTKGYKHTKETILKRSGEKSGVWKGGKVGYNALHSWVARQLGKPKLCEFCKTINAKRFDWANKSGKYLRNITDWIRLCRKCHSKFDRDIIKATEKIYVHTSKHFTTRRSARRF